LEKQLIKDFQRPINPYCQKSRNHLQQTIVGYSRRKETKYHALTAFLSAIRAANKLENFWSEFRENNMKVYETLELCFK